MTEAQKLDVIRRLNEAGATQPCPRCRHPNFIVVEGYAPFSIHQQRSTFGTLIGGGPVVPAVAVACKNCGWLSFHALGILEKWPEGEQRNG